MSLVLLGNGEMGDYQKMRIIKNCCITQRRYTGMGDRVLQVPCMSVLGSWGATLWNGHCRNGRWVRRNIVVVSGGALGALRRAATVMRLVLAEEPLAVAGCDCSVPNYITQIFLKRHEGRGRGSYIFR